MTKRLCPYIFEECKSRKNPACFDCYEACHEWRGKTLAKERFERELGIGAVVDPYHIFGNDERR